MKLVRVRVNKKPLDEVLDEHDAYISGRIEVLKEMAKEQDAVKVNMDPEPISYEALDTRLRNMKLKTIKTGENIRCARTLLAEKDTGGPINILMRELLTLEGLLDSALRHAESVADQIKRQLA